MTRRGGQDDRVRVERRRSYGPYSAHGDGPERGGHLVEPVAALVAEDDLVDPVGGRELAGGPGADRAEADDGDRASAQVAVRARAPASRRPAAACPPSPAAAEHGRDRARQARRPPAPGGAASWASVRGEHGAPEWARNGLSWG